MVSWLLASWAVWPVSSFWEQILSVVGENVKFWFFFLFSFAEPCKNFTVDLTRAFSVPCMQQQLVRTCKSRWVLSFQKMKAREKLFAMVNDYSTGEKKSKGNQGKQREFRKPGRLWRTFLRSKGLSKAIPQGKGTCSYYQLFLSAWMWNGRM